MHIDNKKHERTYEHKINSRQVLETHYTSLELFNSVGSIIYSDISIMSF